MTAKETSLPPTFAGEARSRRRRRIFYAIFLFALILGLAVGVGMGLAEDGNLKFSSTTAWSLAAGQSLGQHCGLACCLCCWCSVGILG
jgi:hypothetical protein